jgi:glyoxylase-like metal-dependent hydrolase (beta-lactamase superfamily II)/8-oxo-dGTP pyrophosphatase MutT (NUDIX family)
MVFVHEGWSDVRAGFQRIIVSTGAGYAGCFTRRVVALTYNEPPLPFRLVSFCNRPGNMPETPVIPLPAATLIPLRDGAGGVEVCMLRRSQRAGFAAGAYVFPGGVVDAADNEADAAALCTGIDDAEASRELGVASGGLAYRVAAIRECFEEAGLLFARAARSAAGASGELLAIASPGVIDQFAELRRALNARETGFVAMCRSQDLRLATDRLVYLSHWITPKGTPRRYDTRFFAAIAPAAQTPLHDGRETVQHLWITPAGALERHRRGELPMLFATAQTLDSLTRFANCEALLAGVRDAQKEAEPHVPRRATGRAGPRVIGRDEFAYAEIGKLDPEGRGTASYEIVPGVVTVLSEKVRRLTAPNPGVMTGPGTNSYLLAGGRDKASEIEIAVIDPGPAIDAHVQALIAAAKEMGGAIRWILTTHTHLDHSPAAQLLKHQIGAQTIGMPPPPYERQDHGFAPDRVPVDGERIEVAGCVLRAIHTPGHASNHLCYLLQDEKLLFTGDHVMQGSTVVINPPDGDMRAYLASLRALLAEDVEYIAPAHGFLIANPGMEIERLLRHRLQRENKIVEALRKTGETGLDALVAMAYDDVPARIHPVAARSLLASLLKLEAEGRASRDGERWRLN